MRKTNQALLKEGPSTYLGAPAAWPPDAAEDDLTFSSLGRLLHRNRMVLGACVVAGVLLATAYCLLKHPEYEGLAQVQYEPENVSAAALAEATGMGQGADLTTQINTQLKILKSNAIAVKVLHDFKISGFDAIDPDGSLEAISPEAGMNAIAAFENSLTVKNIPSTQLIEVRYRARNPRDAAAIANDVVQTYIERNFKTRYRATMEVSDWISKQLQDVKTNAEKNQQKLAEFQRKNGIIGTSDTDNVVTEKLRQINEQLTNAEADRIVKEARRRILATQNPELISTVITSPTLQVLNSQQAQLKVEYAQASTKFGPTYPRVQELESQLNQVSTLIGNEQKDLARKIENEYQSSASTEAALRAELNEQEQKTYEIYDNSAQYLILKREVDAGEELYESLQLKLKEAGVTGGISSNTLTILDKAIVPYKAVVPDFKVAYSIAFGLSLLMGAGLAFLRETLDDTVSSSEQAEQICGAPVLGMVPNIEKQEVRKEALVRLRASSSGETDVISLVRRGSRTSEEFRALRTTLMLSSPVKPPKLIVFTSALSQEGKSFVSSNFAAILAQGQKKVLLVDCDMRHPKQHKIFGVGLSPGLSNLISTNSNCMSGIQEVSEQPYLSMLPAGPAPPNPAELLNSTRFADLLNSWREEFDHVIIDTPPVTAVTDGVQLAAMADKVLLVASARRVTKHALRRACEILAYSHVMPTGVVLNRIDKATQHFYGYYGYGYYGKISHDQAQ